jgi:hypothetical protein
MKVTLVDSKLTIHVIPDLDVNTSIQYIKTWIHENVRELRNKNFVLVYKRKNLNDDNDTLKTIDYEPKNFITIVNINETLDAKPPKSVSSYNQVKEFGDTGQFHEYYVYKNISDKKKPSHIYSREGGSRSKRSARRKKMARTRTIAKRRNTQRRTLRRRQSKK